MSGADAGELGRLRWRCRRGMRELDVLLTRYLDEEWTRASEPDRDAFRGLLERQDTEIHALLLQGGAPASAALRAVLRRMIGEAIAQQ